MEDTDDAVIHAIDRTITDLLPDKHQYEPDLQLYLDYSLPPHPDLNLLEESEEDHAHNSEPEYVILPGDISSRSSPSLDGALQQAIPDQPSAGWRSVTESSAETAEVLQASMPVADGYIEEVEAHQDSSIAHEPSDNGEGIDEGDAFPWPALTPLSDAAIATVPPVEECISTASQESSAAIQEPPGCEEDAEHVPQPDDSERTELPLAPRHDAGHLMPLSRPETGDANLLQQALQERPATFTPCSTQTSTCPAYVFSMDVIERVCSIVQEAKAQEQRQRGGC